VEAIPGWSSATPQWDSPRAHRPSLSTGINRRCRSRTRAARTARRGKGNTHRPGGTAPSGRDVLGPLDVQQGELAVHTHAKLETELSPLLVADRNCRSAGEDDVVCAFEGVRRAVLADDQLVGPATGATSEDAY
jgi:hypothetical protein